MSLNCLISEIGTCLIGAGEIGTCLIGACLIGACLFSAPGMNVQALVNLLEDKKILLTRAEYLRGRKTVAYLSSVEGSHLTKTKNQVFLLSSAKTLDQPMSMDHS